MLDPISNPPPSPLDRTHLSSSTDLNRDSLASDDLNHLELFLYLIPVFGIVPALWTLYRKTGGRQERLLSRLVVRLVLAWGLAYGLLGAGVLTSDGGQLPLLMIASLLTSGYFLVNLWLMVKLWQRRSGNIRSR